jgi:hypothetical protein
MTITFTAIQFILGIFTILAMFYASLKALVPGIAMDAMKPTIVRLEKEVTHIDATFKLLMETEIKRLREDTLYIRSQIDRLRERN